jgi:uncharacterized protein
MKDRFSKENIAKKIRLPNDSLVAKFFKRYVVGIFVLTILPLLLPVFGLLIIMIIEVEFIFALFIQIFLAIIAIISAYYSFIKFGQVRINKVKIPVEKLTENLKITFVSDLHLGEGFTDNNQTQLKKIIDIINSQECDIVILGGDFTGEKNPEKIFPLLKNIKATKKFAVLGNHDILNLRSRKHDDEALALRKSFADSHIKLLENSGEAIDARIFIGGVKDLYSMDFSIDKAFKDAPPDSIKILASHNPDIIDFVEDADGIGLILSGHNHSGQILIRPFGPLLPMPSNHRWLTRGVFQINKETRLFLSQGVGYSGTRVRIGTNAEVCVLELVNAG